MGGVLTGVQTILLEEASLMFNPMEAVFFRSCFLLLFAFGISWKDGENYDWRDLLANILFGVFDTCGISLVTIAVGLISVSDASAITFNKPIPTTILAWILLSEKFDWIDGALSVVNAVGLVVIAKTSVDSAEDQDFVSPLLGVICSFCGLLALSLMYIAARFLAHRQNEDPCLLMFLVGCDGMAISSLFLSVTSSWIQPRALEELFICILLGGVSLATVYSFTRALKTENAMFVSTAVTLSIPTTYLYSLVFKERIVNIGSVIGVCLTMISTFLLYLKTTVFSD
ncbi:Solute carrier family 35 member G1 [Holothuria leucospilota]|uniref:Solute carrier family 35 member G1 n=1 Tax=Holothuria leucospilota TaxID=206669 RepID=A0A9Q0YG23_HOLLE|nr:Solute carrier family 35 member G1 [Holothuria leucospilota]